MDPTDPINILEDQLNILQKYNIVDKAAADAALADYKPESKFSMFGGRVLTPEQLKIARDGVARLARQVEEAEAGRVPAVAKELKRRLREARGFLATDERDTAAAAPAAAEQQLAAPAERALVANQGAVPVDLPLLQQQFAQQAQRAEAADAAEPPAAGQVGAGDVVGMAAAAVGAMQAGQNPIQPVMAIVQGMDPLRQRNVIQAFGLNPAAAQAIAQQLQVNPGAAQAALIHELNQNANVQLAEIEAGREIAVAQIKGQLALQQQALQLQGQFLQMQFQLNQQQLAAQAAAQAQNAQIQGQQIAADQQVGLAAVDANRAAAAAPHALARANILFGQIIAGLITLVGAAISTGVYKGSAGLLAIVNTIISTISRPLFRAGIPAIPGEGFFGLGYIVVAFNALISLLFSAGIALKALLVVCLQALSGLIGLGGVSAAGVTMLGAIMLALVAWKITTASNIALPVGLWGQVRIGNDPAPQRDAPQMAVPAGAPLQPLAPPPPLQQLQGVQLPQFQPVGLPLAIGARAPAQIGLQAPLPEAAPRQGDRQLQPVQRLGMGAQPPLQRLGNAGGSSRRPTSLPTRRAGRSSSSSKRSYTHRRRALRTGKVGYRTTKTGRKV